MTRAPRGMPEAARVLLVEGAWACFVPYLAVYLVGLALDLRCGTVRGMFCGLHVLFLLAIVWLVRERLSLGSRGVPWFWIALLLAFLLPGAYLEFPGDPWMHVSRINQKLSEQPLRATPWLFKFAYFWGWSILGGLAPAYQRAALAVYSAFWQVLLAYQFYRFARRIGFSPAWSRIQVFGVLCVFGNAVFGFFRYYALSSTPLAYIAYLRAGIATLDLAEGRGHRPRSAGILLLTLLLMGFNHLQELLLVALFSMAVLLAEWLAVPSLRRRTLTLGALASLFALSFLLGRSIVAQAELLGVVRAHLAGPYLSASLGCFRIWDPTLSYFKTMGVHGLVAIALAATCWVKAPLVAILTLTAPLVLLFAPFCVALTAIAPLDTTYRVLFLIPDSLMIVSAMSARSVWFGWAIPETGRKVLAVGALSVLGALHFGPFFGKLRFQLFRPDTYLAASYVDPAAQWLRQNRRLPEQCVVTGDPVTETVLASLLGTRTNVDKLTGVRWTRAGRRVLAVENADSLIEYATEDIPPSTWHARACGFLIADETRYRAMVPARLSWVGMRSHHWPGDAADVPRRADPGLVKAAADLPRMGWRRTVVPPFYWYYEPPR